MAPEAQVKPITGDGGTQSILIKTIHVDPKRNSRQTTGLDKDSIAVLAESLRANGLLQSITVRPTDKGFEIDSGYRRLAAAKSLGWEKIEAKILPKETTAQQGQIINLVENLQRDDLTTYEVAHGLEQCVQQGVKQTELIARLQLNKSQSTVDNLLRVYRKLDPRLKAEWAKGEKSKLKPYLSMAGLLDLVNFPIEESKPGEVTQQVRLVQLQGEGSPESIASIQKTLGVDKEAEKDGKPAKPQGKFVRIERKRLAEAVLKLEEADCSEQFMLGCMMAFDFVQGKHGGKLLAADGKTAIYAPEKKVKAGKGKGKKGGKKAKKE